MKNRSFVRLWAPLIAALVFAIAFLATHFALNPREQAKAIGELNGLLDLAEARMAAETEGLSAFDVDADEAAIHKARTVERFLAHDDTLMQPDALLVLCELIELERIVILDSEGGVIASSDAGMLSADLAAEKDTAWCMTLLEEGAEPAAQDNGPSGRIAGVPRTDIEGIVLVWNQDALLANLAGETDLHKAVEHLAAAPDAIKLVETTGENGEFEKDGMLYVQRAEGDLTLIAYRPLSEVYAVQNAVLTSLAIFAALSLTAMFIWQLSARRSEAAHVPEAEADERPAPEDGEPSPDDAEPLPEADPVAEEAPPKRKPRKRRPLIEITETAYDEEEDRLDFAPEPAQRKRRRGPRSLKRGRPNANAGSDDHDHAFDKIFE